MIPIAYLREHTHLAVERLKIRGIDVQSIIADILEKDEKRRQALKSREELQADNNRLSKEIGILFTAGKRQEAEALKQKIANNKIKMDRLDQELKSAEEIMNALLVTLPNMPHISVPKGKIATDNEVVGGGGSRPIFNIKPLPHWELAQKYNLINFELGNKITGAGFPLYVGKGARLQRALINFFLSEAIENGYTEYEPPLLVNEITAYSTGQLPDKEAQMYYVARDNFYLIPTAEVPLTNIYRNELLREDELPKKLTAYTPCFRREAGSYGKDVRGLNRLHQFDKVEIVRIELPQNSYAVLEQMKKYVANLLEKLGLEYRILKLCGGDLGFASAMTYDMEVYSAAQEKWLEVSSVSNFESFQSNRLMLRYKDPNNKTQLLHTLNGSALALPRIVAALLENNQSANGIAIPQVLIPYTGFDRIE